MCKDISLNPNYNQRIRMKFWRKGEKKILLNIGYSD